jgi:hypothetical protein
MRSRRGGGSRGSRVGSRPFNASDSDDLNDELTDEQAADVLAKSKASADELVQTVQIEYLIHQSTLGVHFLFQKKDVARVMMVPTDEREFFTLKNMERVQKLLTSFLEKPTLLAKERYLNSLSATERDLMIRAYFHLVENAIQTNSLKH